MKTPVTLAVAQFSPTKGDVAANLQHHIALIDEAAKKGASLIIFPELSLTGYEPELAAGLALTKSSPAILTLQKKAKEHGITILAGAPLSNPSGAPYLSLFIIRPELSVTTYSKMYLHGIENDYFTQGIEYKIITHQDYSLALAICADTAHPEHIQHAADAGVDAYVASVLISKSGYEPDAALFASYAKEHSMPIFMANYTGTSGPYECAGKAAIWDKNGKVQAQGDGLENMIVVSVLRD